MEKEAHKICAVFSTIDQNLQENPTPCIVPEDSLLACNGSVHSSWFCSVRGCHFEMSEESLCADFEDSSYSKMQEQDTVPLVVSTTEQTQQISTESRGVCVGKPVLRRSAKCLRLLDSCIREG